MLERPEASAYMPAACDMPSSEKLCIIKKPKVGCQELKVTATQGS